ncbi:FkbM family methyltransferase [Henriciella litoralis]|uniref:FkbM family methyltransferase n=1 Tax=Henriciella litoralis TaxID=568102 RepID=UPI000A030483|nr:FkbM family methyltransferase [Henriciella litoralis]
MNSHEMMSAIQADILSSSSRSRDKIGQQLRFIFDKVIESANVTRALEVGAYDAGFSKSFKRKYPDSSVIAFEANPHVYERFSKNVQAQGVDYRHLCIGPENGELKIRIPRDFKGTERPAENQMASLMSNLHTDNTEEVKVACETLDSYATSSADDRFALWIDVEGATSQVFGAAKRILEQTATLFIEVETKAIWDGQWLAKDVDEFLVSQGFIAIARDVQRINQFNFIYAKPDMIDLKAISRLVSRYLMGTHTFEVKEE